MHWREKGTKLWSSSPWRMTSSNTRVDFASIMCEWTSSLYSVHNKLNNTSWLNFNVDQPSSMEKNKMTVTFFFFLTCDPFLYVNYSNSNYFISHCFSCWLVMICRSVWWIKSRKSRRSWITPRNSRRKMQRYRKRWRKWTKSSKMWKSNDAFLFFSPHLPKLLTSFNIFLVVSNLCSSSGLGK